jgi:hypothetical protein
VTWRCADCDRTYDRPPETCRCGSAAVEPDDGDGPADRFSLPGLRRRLLAPGDADRSLVRDEGRVALAFRVLLFVSLLVVTMVAVLLLV